MLRSWRLATRTPSTTCPFRRGIADHRPFREGDLVLLRRKDDRLAPPILSRPLKPGRRIESHKGVVRHDDIIGKRVRDLVSAQPTRQKKDGAGSSKARPAQEFRLQEVKLEEYARLSRRLVTPIYPADARLIVDLLDLHPQSLGNARGDEKLEILEAGTGHGALTLYFARAIAGANEAIAQNSDLSADSEALSAWKTGRKAIVHTIEISERYSNHAEDVVRGFRRGLYYPHVDFHVGDVGEWTTSALAGTGGSPFISHAFLDLPNADHQLDAVAKAMRVDGTLVVFNPSITQIMDAAKKIKKDGIPLEMETVVELGVNGGSGGREWDVRPVKPRATQKIQSQERTGDEEVVEENENETDREEEQVAVDAKDGADDGWSMVCRPKVGERVVGGGFLGVWKKQRH